MLKLSHEKEMSEEAFTSPLKIKKQKAEAYFERLWLIDKDQFNPETNCMGRMRIERTLELIHNYLSPESKIVCDLGCGFGIFSKHLRDKGAVVDAVDIAKNALENVSHENNITPYQAYVPYTQLNDDHYDLVISTELIAFLPNEDFRLYFSEMSRLVKKDGFVVCSTPIDIYSDDALQRFAALVETEFDIDKWIFSYHYAWIKIHAFFHAPEAFVKASKDPRYRKEQIEKRKGLNLWWFRANSTPLMSVIWMPLKWLFQPILQLIRNNKKFLTSMESFSRFLWQDQAISHALFIGKRRPLLKPPPDDLIPIERKAKKIVWE